ncbi:hypothetical protein ACPZMI_06040, partial [Pseudomonas wayambapalatensis]|uniref:hypothetical protein n=1 Tax=Pseudomonas wayambapalatensis TaxID=485895 RepID=UPI003CEF0951
MMLLFAQRAFIRKQPTNPALMSYQTSRSGRQQSGIHGARFPLPSSETESPMSSRKFGLNLVVVLAIAALFTGFW